jgi:hypothetical protein
MATRPRTGLAPPQAVLLPGSYPRTVAPPTPHGVEAYVDAGRSNASLGILQALSDLAAVA